MKFEVLGEPEEDPAESLAATSPSEEPEAEVTADPVAALHATTARLSAELDVQVERISASVEELAEIVRRTGPERAPVTGAPPRNFRAGRFSGSGSDVD